MFNSCVLQGRVATKHSGFLPGCWILQKLSVRALLRFIPMGKVIGITPFFQFGHDIIGGSDRRHEIKSSDQSPEFTKLA